jgi:hypothetical protein
MATLIVDIETVGVEWSALSGLSKRALLQHIDRTDATEAEKERRRNEVRDRLALSPFTGQIVALSLRDRERGDTAVYVVAEPTTSVATTAAITVKVRTERVLLEEFWEGARSYETFITFNGRAFTWPFLYYRSLALGVRPSLEVARERYLTKQTAPYHVDLLDEFSNYGGLTHRPSLALLCGAFNLPHPSILGGEEVEAAYREGEYVRIVEKAAGDADTIAALYERWLQYLAPQSFVNVVENL